MLKKLALGALGAGGVAAAIVGVSIGTANPELCVVTLDANGGSFTELETNVYSRTVSYGDPYGMVFSQEPITNKNFDLKGWTRTAGGTDFIAADSPVTNDAVCYAKWERSAIQRFELENGVFTDEGGEIVAQFPAAFYGVATVVQTNAHVITFTSPMNETWRISFDPQIGSYRICANIRIIHGGDTNTFEFGKMVWSDEHVPVTFSDPMFTFEEGERYRIEIDYAFGEKAWSDIKAPYVFGIGLGGNSVKFDAQEYGTIEYYPDEFRNPGANMSTNLPFGYLPTVEAVNSSVSFLGWFSEKKGGVQIGTSTLVGTNDIYYAHWKLPAYKYYVKFYRDNDAAQGRQMPAQEFTSDIAQALTLNRYYLAQHRFAGWATEPKGKKVYSDGETVVNIWDVPDGTCPLYAVWEQTPGENHFTVSRGVTNFENVAISNLTTYVNGTGSVPEFYMTITNSANLRVSLDPATSCNRMNAKLIVEMRQSGGWTNVCEVTDLSTNEVRHTFVAAQYRFAVTNAPSSYGYVVGLGATGAHVSFDSYGVGVAPTSLSSSLSFNWTTNTPFGYLPTLTNRVEYGKFLGWFKDQDITLANRIVTATNVVQGAETIYAHWQYFPYFVAFDGMGAQPGQMAVQPFNYGKEQALNRNLYCKSGNRFLGWTDRATGTNVVYADCAVVSNLCTTAGTTNWLYAVWEPTPGENRFTVSQGMTNFVNVAVSNMVTYVNGPGSVPGFCMTLTNSATLRVSLDPEVGTLRTNALLLVEHASSFTNGVPVWTEACQVTDLATNAVAHTFTNGVYRFTVKNVASSYAYVVGLGATGAQFTFDPSGATVAPSAPVRALSFNWSVDTPVGYLPPLTGGAGDFLGYWYDNGVLSSNQVHATNIVAHTTKVYARWSNQTYYVAFDGKGATGGKMAPQAFAWNVPQALNYNQYYKTGQRFAGWEDRIAGTNYTDHAVVSNLCATAGGTNGLCAVWAPSAGTNIYYVTSGMTNFANIVLSPKEPSFFMGHGDTACFTVTPANLGEATKCRVSIDPDGGFRTNALLTIERALAAATHVAWTNVCTVTDLSEKEVTCTFATNYQYRFTISGVAPSYAYAVGVGAAGSQYTFEPCGGTVSPSAPVKNLSFNWTVDAPLGYLPPLTNDVKYGTYTWHYTPEADKTNLVFATNHVAASATTCYAHWSKGVIVPIVLDWNLTSYGVATNVVVTNYYGQGTKMSLPRPSYENWGFLGWTTNLLATSGWLPDTVVISNTATYFGQWSKEWRLSVYNGGWSIDGYNGTWVGPLALPSYIAPKNVYAVGASAFARQNGITSLVIPAGVTFVGDAAFEECTALKSVVFPSVYPESEYATDGFLDNEIELGTDLFLNCTALTDVQLPLGVWRLPDGIFCGCTALTTMDMPWTVREIGVGAFEQCNHLQELVVTEGVDALESCAFAKCTRMKKICFIGSQPESFEGDIFKGTQRNLLVGYLQNMCETAQAYCGGNWPALPGLWPAGSLYPRTLTWIGEGLYPRYKVSFNHNDGDTPALSTVTPVLYHAGRVFGLMAPTADVMGEGFSGWWTQPVGGRKIGNYREVTAGMTVYAHWDGSMEETEIGSRSDEDYPVYWDPTSEDFTGFYSAEDDLFYYSACAFNGIVVDEGGVMAGTVVFTFQEGGMTDDGMSSSASARIAWTGGKSLSLSGRVDADGLLTVKSSKWSFVDTMVTKSGIYGTLVDETEGVTYRVYAARNRYAMSTDAARTVVLTALQATRGTWHVVLQTESAESEEEGAAAYAEGYTTLAITIAGMGQATIEGTTGDGTKISTTATLIVGDGCAALPVVVRPYSGSGGFSFFIWFAWRADGSIGEDETRIHGLTAWDATRAAHPFAATFCGAPDPDPDDFPVTFIDDKRYEGGATFDCEDVSAELVIKGTTWKVVGENPNKVKLSYQAATGLFTGSFTVETSEGKTARATVSGAFTDRILDDCSDLYHGYGTAVISGVGSFPVEVTTTE